MSEPSGEIAEQAASGNAYEFSVSELSQALKRTVEENFGHVRVRGEVTGYRGPHASGHVYFALKDETARMDAVIWKGNFSKLRFKPAEGLEVIATGKLTTYPGSSKYQIVIERLEPAGLGALMALLEERRKKLAAEGLFAEERKKKLPFLPEVIGVVTSPTGAVIRDILHRLSDRFPRHVLVWPVRVQGETSAAEVAAAIKGFNELKPGGKIPRPDLLIVARGGGSIEDLWSFNEEIVVRAAAESKIPLISAVGHETDTTLIDYAADRRAPTPTAAAEMAVPVRAELLAAILDSGQRLFRAETRRFEHLRTQLRGLARALTRPQDLVAVPRQKFDYAASRLVQALKRAAEIKHAALKRAEAKLSPGLLRYRMQNEARRLRDQNSKLVLSARRHLRDLMQRVEASAKLLEAYSYQGVLSRGFAVVRDAAGKPVRSSAGLKMGDRLDIEFSGADRIGVSVEKPGTSAAGSSDSRPKKAKSEAGGGQGTLL